MTFTFDDLKSLREEGFTDDQIGSVLAQEDQSIADVLKEGFTLEQITSTISGQQIPEGFGQPPATEEGFLRQAADIPVNIFKGGVTGTRMVTDVFGAANPVSKSLAGVEDYMDTLLSAQARQDQQTIARILKDAEDKGVLDQVVAGVEAFSVAPADTLANAFGTMIPVLATGLAGSVARLAPITIKGVQLGMGAAMGAGTAKGEIYNAVYSELENQGYDPETASKVASEAQAYNGKNLDTILLNAGLGGLAASTGAEKILTNVITKSGGKLTGGAIEKALKGGITEGGLEGLQGGTERGTTNIALQREGVDVPTMRGVVAQATMEGVAGLGMGAAVGPLEPDAPPTQKPPPPKPPPKPPLPDDVREQRDIERDAAKVARELSVDPNDANARGIVNETNRLEQKIENNKVMLSGMEPTSREHQRLSLEIAEDQKNLAALKGAVDKLSEPIAAAEAEQARLARELAAPVEEAVTPPVEPAAAPVSEPITPTISEKPATSELVGAEPTQPTIREVPEISPIVGAEPTSVVEQEPVAPEEEAPAITPAPAAETPAVTPAAEVAPVQRDITKPEQMTPEEVLKDAVFKKDGQRWGVSFGGREIEGGSEVYKDAQGVERVATLGAIRFKTKTEAIAALKGAHSRHLNFKLSKSEPVSAAAIESYGITLPEGYTKQGDLYVYQPTPAAPAAEPAGIAVGSRVKGKGPQTYTIEEVIPQTDTERELGEQYYSVKNERTGEVQTVEAKDIKPVKAKGARKIAADQYPTIGININDKTQNFTDQILSGEKTIETRDTDSLRRYVGQRIGIVRTGKGKATLVGYADIGEPIVYNNANEFRADQDKHLVEERSKFDIKSGEKKYGYPLTNIQSIDPIEIPPNLSNWRSARFIPQPTSPDIRREAATRVKDESLVVPEAERYTFEQAQAEATKLFGGMPEGFVIVNDSVDPELEFKAGYEPSTGNIILNLAYIRQGESVRNLIAHELGHYAAGDPAIRAKLQEFLDALPPATRAKLERFVERVYNDETGDIRLEEKQVRAFVQMLKTGENRNAFQKLLDAIKKWLNDKLGTNFQPTDMDAAAVLSGAVDRFRSGEKIAREDGEMREAKVERYDKKSQVAGVPGIGAIKDTPKGINVKTEKIIKDQVFDSDIVSDNQTKKAWNLIDRLQESNPEAGATAKAINELTRETMQDVEAEDIVKQTIGAAKLRNELFKYAIKLTAEGDKSMLDYLLNNRLAISGGAITEGDAGRLLQALSSLKSWIVRSSESEQKGFFTIAAQQFFDTKNPTDKQIKQIQDMFEAVKKVKVDQEKDLMTELEEVGNATGIDLPAVVQKQLDATPGLDPMVVAMINMIKLAGGGRIVFEKFPSPRGEAVKKTILGGLADYRKKMVGKGATGLETGFWKTLSDKEEKPGPLGELDAYQNRELGNIVKSTLIGMGLKGTPPDTKMTIYEQVATILGEQPLGKEKIKMADERISEAIGAKREAEVENARSEEEVDAINAKYDQIQFAWDEAMSRQTEMPVSDALIRRLIFAELKEADTSIADIATLMDEEPAIGASRQDTLVRQIIEKITDKSFDGKEYAQLQSYLSEALESMVIARQQKNRTAKSITSIKRQAGGDPTKQAQAQIDKLAKIQADPTIFGEKKIDPVRNAVRDALSLQLNIGFTPAQTADIKRNWKGAYVADPNQKGLPSSFMLEMQRLGVKESAADILAEIVWKQIEVNAMSKQMDATTKAVEAGPIGGMAQAILDTPLAMQQDPDWQKTVILDYLKNAGVKPAQAEKIAKLFDISLRKRFAQAQEQAAEKAAKAIMGKLTPNSRRALEKFMRAIRAQVLDPGTDVAKTFGEQMGWKGFTKEDITRLNELDSIVNDSERTDAEVTVAIEQINQIIDKVSLPPQVKDVISSYYVGNILGRFTTFAIQAVDPLMFTTFDAAVKSFTNITNPAQLMSVWANYGRAVSNLMRETAFSFKNDVLRSGKMIDYMNNEDRKIGRLWREAERKYKAGDIKGAMKDSIIGYTSQTFRVLKALDDGAYSLLITNTLPSYVDAALKAAKVPRDKRRGVMRRILEAREIDIKNFENQGVPRNDAIVYANERMTLAVQQELGNMKLPEGTATDVVNSALNDALSRIGKTRFMEDVLGGDKQELKDEGFFSSIFLRFYENVAKSVNQKGGSEWQKVFYRVLLGFPLIPARIFNISAGYTPLTIYRHLMPQRYSLTYGTSLQRRQRLLEQMAGTMVLLPLLMLRSSSFDDEEEKERGFGVYITGQGPSRAKDKETHAQWNRRHKPYSIEFVVGGKKASIDARSSGPLAVMIYTLGALDDWQIRRIQDGMKTTKEDLKDIEEKSDLFTAMYDLAGSFVLTTARRGPTTGVMQGLVNFQRYPDDPIAAIGQEAAFAAAPAIPILGTGIAKNLSDFFSEPIDTRTKEGALISNFPIVGPVLGQPALNAYGQKIGELQVSEKLKKSFGIPFTLVPTQNENDYKLSAITLKFGNGPTHLRRDAVEAGVGRAISDEEWYKAASAYGKYNREKILESYDYHFGKSQEKFDKTMTKMSKKAKDKAIQAVTEKTP